MDQADVVIVTALEEEYAAVKRAADPTVSAGSGVATWEERNGDLPYSLGQYVSTNGESFIVALAWQTRMGGRTAGPIAGALLERLEPSLLAMCGVCAGNPAVVALGDVVVAEMTYAYDEGKRTAGGFLADHRQLTLPDRQIRLARGLSSQGLPSHGLATEEEAKIWFLERLANGQEPRDHPARQRYFRRGQWQAWPEKMEKDGLIAWAGSQWELTDKGRTFISRTMYYDVDGPDQLPFEVVVGPIASGDVVVKDGITWERLKADVRTVAGLEMEAATIATAAYQKGRSWLVVKGIMDHADPRKDDRYKRFAARASAEVLFALLERFVPLASGHRARRMSLNGQVC